MNISYTSWLNWRVRFRHRPALKFSRNIIICLRRLEPVAKNRVCVCVCDRSRVEWARTFEWSATRATHVHRTTRLDLGGKSGFVCVCVCVCVSVCDDRHHFRTARPEAMPIGPALKSERWWMAYGYHPCRYVKCSIVEHVGNRSAEIERNGRRLVPVLF